MGAKIPTNLLNKLRDISPDIGKILEGAGDRAFEENGRFSGKLLERYLVDRRRAEAYRRISDRGQEVYGKMMEGGSIVEGLRDWGWTLWEDVTGLVDAEGRIAEAIGEYEIERNRGDAEALRTIVGESVGAWKQKVEEAVGLYDKQLEAIGEEAARRIQSLENSGSKDVNPFLSRKLNLLQKENRRTAKAVKKLLGDNVELLLNRRIDGLSGSKGISKGLEFTEGEIEKIGAQLKRVLDEEVARHRKIRKEMVEGLLERSLGIGSREALIRRIDGEGQLTKEDKELLKEYVGADYLTNGDVRESIGKGVVPDRSGLQRIGGSIAAETDDRRRRLSEIYNGKTWHVCNGGWWAGFAHLATFGFCTGFTMTAAVVSALNLDVKKLSELAVIVGLITLAVGVPLFLTAAMGIPSGIAALAGSGILIFVAKEVDRYYE